MQEPRDRVIRQQLPVPGAWAYGRRGDAIVVVVDECYTKAQAAEFLELAKLKLSSRSDGVVPSHSQ